MNKKRLKELRKIFRESVFKRDDYKCKLCGSTNNLDAHHITDRHLIINDGYVLSNGITVCESCHLKVEEYHSSGGKNYSIHPDELYKKIGTSKEVAIKDSEKLS